MVAQFKFLAKELISFIFINLKLIFLSGDSSQNQSEKVKHQLTMELVRTKIDDCLTQLHQHYLTISDWMSFAFYFFTSTVFVIILFSVLLYYFLIDCAD